MAKKAKVIYPSRCSELSTVELSTVELSTIEFSTVELSTVEFSTELWNIRQQIGKSKKNWKELAKKKLLWNIRQWRLFYKNWEDGWVKKLVILKYFLTIYPKILKVLKNQGDPWNSKYFCREVKERGWRGSGEF